MIEGGCHCGNVRWSFGGTPDEATAWNCTICRRYGALWIYDYEGENVNLSGPSRVYMWGDRKLGFHFCAECGCVAACRWLNPQADGRHRIAVNVRLADPKVVGSIPIGPGIHCGPGSRSLILSNPACAQISSVAGPATPKTEITPTRLPACMIGSAPASAKTSGKGRV